MIASFRVMLASPIFGHDAEGHVVNPPFATELRQLGRYHEGAGSERSVTVPHPLPPSDSKCELAWFHQGPPSPGRRLRFLGAGCTRCAGLSWTS
jgi:hypothetical protein